jgi:hypothetical protein
LRFRLPIDYAAVESHLGVVEGFPET